MRLIVPCVTAVLFAACASAPVPVTRSPQSPAHPGAPEAVTPPAEPVLMAGDDDAVAPPAPATRDMDMPKGHVMPSQPPSQDPQNSAAVYTCPMHPEVAADKPGSCPVCGMALVKKKTAPDGGSR